MRKYLILKQTMCAVAQLTRNCPPNYSFKYANKTEERKFSIKALLKAFVGNIKWDDVSK